MAALPQIPVFEQGDWHLFRLQQLSAAVAFACRIPVVFHLYKTLSVSFGVVIGWDAASADSDGGWALSPNPSRYTVQTPGYFHVDAGINAALAGVDGAFLLSFRITTGPGNPAGAGIQTFIGSRSDDTSNATGPQESLSLSAMTPYMYVGDYIEVIPSSPNTPNLTAGWNGSGNNDLNGFPDGSPSFTGMLVSPGTWNPGTGTWGP